MSKKLTEQDYEDAAESLGVEVAAIKAVCEVEAPKGGFLPSGHPTLLFERHKFSGFTNHAFDAQHPDISNKKRGGYIGGEAEWSRFMKANKLNPEAAIKSASWGKFQIMGFNFADCGFDDVHDFLAAMNESEGAQLKAFVALIKSWHLADELRAHRWADFAAAYNGAAYRENQYDVKMAKAYRKYKGILRASTVPDAVAASGLESSSTVAPAELAADTAAPQQAVESGASAAQINLAPPVEPKPIVSKPGDAPIEATTGSFKSMVTSAIGWLTGAGAGVVALLKDNQTLLIIAAAVLVIAGLAYFIRQLILDRERLRIASDPHKYNAK
jgi:hypothetical protein